MRRTVVILTIVGVVAAMALVVGGAIGGAFVYTMLNRPAVLAAGSASQLAPENAQASQAAGIVVVQVDPDGPAGKAGLQRGDIVTAVDGKPVNTMPEVVAAVQAKKAGDTVSLTITRAGASQDLTVTLPDTSTEGRKGLALGFVGVGGAPGGDFPMKILRDFQGMVVTEVKSGSPAEAAGLKVDDVITAVDDQAVDQAHNLPALIAGHKPGDTVKLKVTRGDQTLELSATLTTHPDDASKGYLGVSVRPNGPMGHIARAVDGPAVVHGIEDGSPAQAAGLQEGDVITAVDGQKVDTVGALNQIIAGHKPGDTITLTVKRGDQELSLPVTLGGKPWLGAMMGPAMKPFGVMPGPIGNGVQVVVVLSGSPAEAAGVKTDDVILAVDGQTVGPEHSLPDLIASHKPGDTVQLQVKRGDQELTLSATLVSHPDDSSKAYLGVKAQPVFSGGAPGQKPMFQFVPGQPGAPDGQPFFRIQPNGPDGPNFELPAPKGQDSEPQA